ncbi:MAG: c-type cytochrome [Acidimicrobiia bacterium]
MFKRIVDGIQALVALAALATLVLLVTVSPTIAEVDIPDLSAGAELFASNCSACHGPAGAGGLGPALAGGLENFKAVEDVARFVSNGVPGRMPGFETRLTPDQVNAVAQFVWTDLAGR